MPPTRHLRLQREALAELTSDDLSLVVAATRTTVAADPCSYVDNCPSGKPLCSILCPNSWHTEEC